MVTDRKDPKGPAAGEPGSAERRCWDNAAAGWEKWWDSIEAASRPVSERLVALAAIEAGDRVLDLATGSGEPAVTAAHRVGPDGRVEAVDISPAMIEAARRRTAALGVTNIAFHAADIAQLPFEAGSFDAALCRWGLMFLPDVAAGLHDLRRLLRPGARLAAAAWGPPSEVPMIGLERQALAPYLPADFYEHGIDKLTAFRFCETGAFERVLRDAGYRDVTCEPVTVTYVCDSPAAYVQYRRDITLRDAALAEHNPPDKVEAAWRALAEAAEAFAGPDGQVRMTNIALCAAGSA